MGRSGGDGSAVARRPTIHDVAARAGVSKSLVSLVLRGAPTVTPARREAVRQAMLELGYRRNGVARSLVEQRSRAVGVLVSHLHNPFFAEVIDGIVETATLSGYTVLLGSGNRVPVRELAAMDALLESQVDGLIMLSPTLRVRDVERARAGAPTVVVGRRYPRASQVDAVLSDDEAGTALAVRHLVGLGHRRVAHIGGGRRAGAPQRWRGYRRAMIAAGLGEDLLVMSGDFTTEEGGYLAMQALLAEPVRPTAVFAVNDMSAIGALDALADAGYRVPQDMSVVGYDNTAVASLRRIALTTVNQPRFDMGRRAAELLAERIAGNSDPTRTALLTPDLVVRGTCGPAPG